jgi:hypothetical protein
VRSPVRQMNCDSRFLVLAMFVHRRSRTAGGGGILKPGFRIGYWIYSF